VFGKWIWIISLKSNIIPLTRTKDIIQASAEELSTKDLTRPGRVVLGRLCEENKSIRKLTPRRPAMCPLPQSNDRFERIKR